MKEAHPLGRFSIGVGDRFAHQAQAQLRACMKAEAVGVIVAPVWNKSNREHMIIGSGPEDTRAAADAAVTALGWKHPYFCDADHITLRTVDRYLASCDFFTIDVADRIGTAPEAQSLDAFVRKHAGLIGTLALPGVDAAITVSRGDLERVGRQYLAAAEEAGRTYRHIEQAKGRETFLTEVSMDETDAPQKPVDLLLVLAMLADAGIPLATIAPKFTGRFNKGVDYVGDPTVFAREFALDIAVLRYAVNAFGLPAELKLSLHSGSDKFSLYGAIHTSLAQMNAGLHLKTAGTTWLEEVIGLAEAGGDALVMVKEIYAEALGHRDELCAPYATVIDIDSAHLPSAAEAKSWNAEQWTGALRHDPGSSAYNRSLRQLMHVGFKVAANLGGAYTEMLEAYEASVAANVTRNLFDRHIRPVFLGAQHAPRVEETTL